jgi:hypothetical protein
MKRSWLRMIKAKAYAASTCEAGMEMAGWKIKS